MMYCEICGAEIRVMHRISIEGSELSACDSCAHYGKDVKKAVLVSRRRRVIYDQMTDEFAPDYYKIIRKARQAHGWTQEELASMVKERTSLIRKIERGDLLPEDGVRKKLEHALGIKLTERVMEPRLDVQTPKELTFGEVVVIKRKKEI